MDNTEKINNQLNSIHKIDIERREKYYEWIKNIVSLSVVFLGIIISLKSENCISDLKRLFFIISLSSMTLGILLGVIVLYSVVHVLSRHRSNILEHTHELLQKKETSVLPKPTVLKGYDYVAFFCLFFYIISLISFVIYSSIKN